jgi:hypothetical protein
VNVTDRQQSLLTASALERAWYAAPLESFCSEDPDRLLGQLARRNAFPLVGTQRDAWIEQTRLLQKALAGRSGKIYLEFAIPRMGSRIDAVVVTGPVVLVIEFKVGERRFLPQDVDQVVDYALDLHHFHEGTHGVTVAPLLVCTEARADRCTVPGIDACGGLLEVTRTSGDGLKSAIERILEVATGTAIPIVSWEQSGYKPTPTIIEATLALYRGHSVAEITHSEAGKTNLSRTSRTVDEILRWARDHSRKAVCFVTGVPGAGKTLVGLDAATRHIDTRDELYSVFLSGNGPLVAILQEALARDKVRRAAAEGRRVRKGEARSEVKAFIQNVHHFRDECLRDREAPPPEHVAIFDEAQRAWNRAMTVDFMKRKKGVGDFAWSEPAFLLSCLDRHKDWAVVICLVGGGQEINRGEAGIREWLAALRTSFQDWVVYISDQLADREYGAEREIAELGRRVEFRTDLHLSTSVRSFRSEKVSRFVKDVLDLELDAARATVSELHSRFPIVLTRDLRRARAWLKARAKGSERYGIVVSSQAERLKPHAVDIRAPVNPIHWFLGPKEDVRSSYYLEDVATEFHVQGLELDWTCVVWDADFRHTPQGWAHWMFRGDGWQRIRSTERQVYLKNAYRVLLTRARQGMVIVVPEGEPEDPTRLPSFYDPTFRYLQGAGIQVL